MRLGATSARTRSRRHARRLFTERIHPVLTPLAVDPAHPFPYISGLSLNLAVVVADEKTGAEHFARVKVPPLLPRLLAADDAGTRLRAASRTSSPRTWTRCSPA